MAKTQDLQRSTAHEGLKRCKAFITLPLSHQTPPRHNLDRQFLRDMIESDEEEREANIVNTQKAQPWVKMVN